MIIGRVVKSNSHVDYVCHIFGPGELPETPRPRDHALGHFVRIPIAGEEQSIVGLIYDTILLNPEFGNLGPRLSPEPELEVFSPDYLNEKAVLVGIVAVGSMGPGGSSHAVPAMAPVVGAETHVLTDEEVAAFHLEQGRLRLGYLPRLMTLDSPVLTELLVRIASDLEKQFPDQAQVLAVWRNNLSWKLRVEGAQ